ncbi:AMP-binding protein [Streptomyces sp. AC563]|uniref:AMP-binding protein n=1 Tax=Streptomyces buecherae TaxID=2763006 RepID=UPI00164E7AEA|nr:AMP-binding protein [Streptomyces buecherae]MBC3982147.1 AMP-binding protein [Streptomyces buecherae]MBC3991838.1 AMP-binding protein [Streptomyces buecherae]QNJ40551.1 AMP-binding protein [Streptomyces buecherae]
MFAVSDTTAQATATTLSAAVTTPAAVSGGSGEPVALRWVGEQGRAEEFTHTQLLDQATRASSMLTELGVCSGDQVAVMLPLVPESVVTTLACGRLDASRVSLPMREPVGALRERIRESGARVLITVDGVLRDGRAYGLKTALDRALMGCPEVETVLVVHRLGLPVRWVAGRDHWWHERLAATR